MLEDERRRTLSQQWIFAGQQVHFFVKFQRLLLSNSASETTARKAGQDQDWHRFTIVFLVVTSVLRLCLLPMKELAADEAYYWDWSRHLALGYYDQGPLIAYLIRLTTAVAGVNEFGVRLGVWGVSCGTLLGAYVFTCRFASAKAGFLTVLFLALTPLFTAGSLIATYDPPLVFFWMLSLLALERALFASDGRSQDRGWAAAGLWSGLGLLSKHTMLFIAPCLLLFLLLSRPHRRWLSRPHPYLAFLLMLLLYSGVLWWNATHHWWTFGHLGYLVGKDAGTPLRRFGDLIGSQALLIGPGLFLGGLWALWKTARYGREQTATEAPAMGLPAVDTTWETPRGDVPHFSQTARLFLCCFGLPVLAFFCLMTFKAKVQANWAPCGWITPTIALAIFLADARNLPHRAAQRVRLQIAAIALTSGVLTLLLLFPQLRLALGIQQKSGDDIENKMTGGRQMGREAGAILAEMQKEGRPVFLAGNDYQTCALLAFYVPGHPQTYDLFMGYRLNFYAAHVEELKAHMGANALYVNETTGEDSELHTLFERVQWSGPKPVWRRPYFAQPIRSHYYGRCYRFRRFIGISEAHGG